MPESNTIALTFNWGNITVAITVEENWTTTLPLDHVSVRTSKPTPLSGTGYKSLYLAHPCREWVVELIKERLGDPDPQLFLF